jgi:hypothetical protein
MAKTEKSVALGVTLDTAQLKASAESGEAALAKLHDTIKADGKELQAMQRAVKELKAGTGDYTEQVKTLEEAITAKKESIATARSQVIAFGGSLTKAASGGKGLHAQLAELQKVVGGMPGPLGAVVALFSRLTDVVKNNPIKTIFAAIGAGMVALVAKTAMATASLVKYSIAQADARRTELLRLEGLTKIRNYYGVAAGSASDLQDAIDSVSASSALSRNQIGGLAEQLYKAHFRGENLTAALEAAAIKTSTQGQEQASMWIGYAEAINRTGGNVKGFAQNVRNQLGGIAQKQMLSATVQAEKLQESYSQLTNGVRIEPLLKARKAFNDLFSQSTSSGKALKQLLGFILQPLIDAIAKVQRLAKPFFQGMILACQELVMAGLEVADMFGVTFAETVPDSLEDAETATKLGRAAFDLLAGALWAVVTVSSIFAARMTYLAITSIPGVVRALIPMLASIWSQVVAWGALALEVLAATWPLVAVGLAAWAIWEAFDYVFDAIMKIDWWGLVGFIFKPFAWLADGVIKFFGAMGRGIKSIFTDELEMHSPSRVFERYGENIGAGLQAGIDSTAPDVNQSVEHLVTVPKAPTTGAGAGAGNAASSSAGASGNIIIESINLSGFKDPASAATEFVTELGKALRVVGYQLGTTTTAGAGA